MPYKKETWLVYYRMNGGKLNNAEIPTKSVMQLESMPDMVMEMEITKAEALDIVSKRRAFKDFERDYNGLPIVKRMCYV